MKSCGESAIHWKGIAGPCFKNLEALPGPDDMIIGGDPTDERREPLNCPDEVAHSVLHTEIISSTIAFATSRYACSSRSRSRRRPIGLGQELVEACAPWESSLSFELTRRAQ